jgi:cytochrome c oxidase subunit 3
MTEAIEAMTGTIEAAHPQRRPMDHLKLGMWFFLGSETMFFAGLISMFVHFKVVDPSASDVLDVSFTAVNTLILLTSSFTMVRGLSAIRDNDRQGLWVNMIATGFLGLIFLMGQALEFSKLAFEGTGLNSIFGSTFFILTGFHGLHVFIGVLWIVYILARVYKAKIWNAGHQMQVEIFGLYWHFVDVVWVILFTIIYLIR